MEIPFLIKWVTVCERTFCGEGSCTAWLSTIGPTAGLDPESYVHSKYIVI